MLIYLSYPNLPN